MKEQTSKRASEYVSTISSLVLSLSQSLIRSYALLEKVQRLGLEQEEAELLGLTGAPQVSEFQDVLEL